MNTWSQEEEQEQQLHESSDNRLQMYAGKKEGECLPLQAFLVHFVTINWLQKCQKTEFSS